MARGERVLPFLPNEPLTLWGQEQGFRSHKWILPIQESGHWVFVILCFRTREITLYSSLGGYGIVLQNVKEMLEWLHEFDEPRISFEGMGWRVTHSLEMPRQTNGYDCGVFVCKGMEDAVDHAPLSFSQRNMPEFRKEIKNRLKEAWQL